MDARLRIVFVVLVLAVLKVTFAAPLTTIASETEEPTTTPSTSPCFKLLKALLGDHHTVTPGPDDVASSSTESDYPKRVRSLLDKIQPLHRAHNAVMSPQPIPIYINTYSDSSPVNVMKDTNGALSIHISTKIDFSGSASLLHMPQGSVLGPLVLNNNIQFHVAEPQKTDPPKGVHYYEYSDDEDYYMDEGSGSHHLKTSEAPTTIETTESVSTTVGV